jgi:hypothetical protein
MAIVIKAYRIELENFIYLFFHRYSGLILWMFTRMF